MKKWRKMLAELTPCRLNVPNAAREFEDISRALKVHPNQVAEANDVAQSMGCGAPFRSDGMFVGTRSAKNNYMREINRRRVDRGEERMVNYDGGFRDVT